MSVCVCLIFIYLLLAALGLCCCTRAFSSCRVRASLPLWCTGFLLQWLLLLQSMCSRASVVAVHGLSSCVTHRLSCPVACVILLDQGSNGHPCFARQIFNHWATREVPALVFYGQCWSPPEYSTLESVICISHIAESTVASSCYFHQIFKMWGRNFPGGPVFKFPLPMPGARVWSLVRELSCHMPCGVA